ncbi:MAG: TlpA family protein disulfide reductase [Candidatus Omnitrophica bacterium]|nr:TlpA family protein disulfide reductase [Candidatus Omnitrophota bacterium]
MQLKLTVSVLIMLLPVVGLIISREGFPNRQTAPVVTEDDFLKKLNIEILDKKVRAPDFTLRDLQGNAVRLQDFRGKVVFLNFWATWCPPCRLEMPTMEELHREFSDQGLVVLAVNFRESQDEVRSFLKQHGLTFTTLLDEQERAFGLYRAWSLPTTYLINKNSEIVGKVIGYRDWHSEQAKAFFRQLLEDQA